MDAGLQELLDSWLSHGAAPFSCMLAMPPGGSCGPGRDARAGRRTRDAVRVGLDVPTHDTDATAQPRAGELERAREVGRQRRDEREPVAAERLVELEPRGVQELALEAVAPGGAVLADRRRRDGRSPGSGRGSGACARSRAAPAAASTAGSASSSVEVRARLARAVGVDRAPRAQRAGRGPSGASIVPLRAGGRPSTSARYSRTIRRASSAAFSRRWASSPFATTSRPDVSRSRRCTIPGRHGSPPAAPRAASRCDSVPARVRPGRVHDEAGRLVDDHQVVDPRRRTASGPSPSAVPGRRSRLIEDLDRLAAAQPVVLARRRAVQPHRARRDPALRLGARAEPPARGRGRRARPPRQAVRAAAPPRPRIRNSATTPSVIDASARLKAGQCGSWMKSVTAPAADAVEQVAERAADDQAGREPQQAPAGGGARRTPSTASDDHDRDHDDHAPRCRSAG